MNERIQKMEKIFSPRSVALIGASNSFAKWGGIVSINVLLGGFAGKIYPVNPKEKAVHGLTAYPSVKDIPGPIDLAVIIVPADGVPEVISDCVAKAIPAAIVITSGFAELGDRGRVLQNEMLKRARAGGMVLVGPNGQGIAAPDAKFYPWFPTFRPDPGVIGIASQSGGISTELSEQLAEFGFGCSKVVSTGNCADLTWPDYLAYFREDPATRVVLLYMEGAGEGRAFFREARDTALKKPVIIIKSGRTREGGRAASSHTGSLAGSDDVFDGACRQAGLIRARTLEEAAVLAAAFVTTPLPKGRRVCVLTGGGGQGVLTADALADRGLDLAPLPPATIAELKKHLPAWWSPNNPVDMVAGLGYGGPREIIPILMESGAFDGVIFNGIGWIYSMVDPVNFPQEHNPVKKGARRVIDEEVALSQVLIEYSGKWGLPLLVTSKVLRLAIRRNYEAILNLLNKGIMVYPTAHDVVNVFAALADRYEFLKKNGAV
ncbi:MAG: CoA-binding protein [Thermodesulfobacteriota bacterium]